jgi:DNA-binding NarL/FixJ family response regulator
MITNTGSYRIVIFQRSPLIADALAVLVRRHSAWTVHFATAELGAAIAAASDRGISALLFESPVGRSKALSALIRRLRISCPGVPLILVTQGDGAGFLRGKAARSLAAIVHFQDAVEAAREALDSVEGGYHYRSPVIRQRLKLAPTSGRKVRRIGVPPLHRSGRATLPCSRDTH